MRPAVAVVAVHRGWPWAFGGAGTPLVMVPGPLWTKKPTGTAASGGAPAGESCSTVAVMVTGAPTAAACSAAGQVTNSGAALNGAAGLLWASPTTRPATNWAGVTPVRPQAARSIFHSAVEA